MTVDRTRALIETHQQHDEELLARVDRHLRLGVADSSPEHLARGVELEACVEEHLGRPAANLAVEHGVDERRRFELRRDSLRNERALAEAAQALVKRAHDLVRYFVDDGRAHRDALRRVCDKLELDDGREPRRLTRASS